MGALNPLFLIAGLAIAVPIFLHLFQRQQTRRFSFPALRYLERTEREHARRIRIRQLLLLLTRVAVILLLVGAGARLIFGGRGSSHPPTAVVVVLDNSMSSGLVQGQTRVLDELKALALRTLDGASPEDRFWVIRAGEPWLPAIPGGAEEARTAINETEPSAAAGDLSAALQRAAELLRTAALQQREIHLLSDLQRTAFTSTTPAPAGDLPVVVWTGTGSPPENRALTSVLVGAGLPPLEGQRTEVTVRALEDEADTTRRPVRLVVDDRIRGAGTVSPGQETTIALPPTGAGWVLGYVDADPDALSADDRRYFAYRSRRAPTVAVAGDPGVFVTEAMSVLQSSGRVRTASIDKADVLIAQDGEGLDQRGRTTAALVLAPADEALLPAVNRHLSDAGIPWAYGSRAESGGAELGGTSLPDALAGTRALEWFRLATPGGAATPARTLAEAGGDPWAVDGSDASNRRFLLLASPLTAAATTLPVSTGMVRFLDWVASDWAGVGGTSEQEAGSSLPAPEAATHVRFPSGREVEIDGTRTVRGTGEAGFYTFLAADTTVAVVALNPPPSESSLEPLQRRDFPTAIGAHVTAVSRAGGWPRAVYRSRRGPEVWWPLLLACIVLLVVESVLASSGRAGPQVERRSPPSAEAPGALS
jgi:Aerotolerance regulator N-terminal/von Willebrand factor type A domain